MCRACKTRDLKDVLTLGNQALTGVFLSRKDEKISSGPLELVQCCGECKLVQLKHSYDEKEMYGNGYGYRSSLNKSMMQHLRTNVDLILKMEKLLKEGDTVVDIGSNDGTTLSFYPKNKFNLVGVDPTAEKFRLFYRDDITIIPDFFSRKKIIDGYGDTKAKVITSFSMFYDLEDPVEFVKEIVETLHDDGIWVFEQSYLASMLKQNSFDTICHEHLEYYSLRTVEWILNKAGMKVIDVYMNDTNGGSFLVFASKNTSSFQPNEDNIHTLHKYELSTKEDDLFSEFSKRVETEKINFLNFISNEQATGKKFAAIGASTKGNVLLQFYGLDSTKIEAIGEVNKEKYGKFTPGTHIPIIEEHLILDANYDYYVVLPWHFKEFFIQNDKFKGKRLIFPLPYFEVFDC